MRTIRSQYASLTVSFGLFVAAGLLVQRTESSAAERPQAGAERGELSGRFTAADTGKPVAGAKVRVFVQGVSTNAAIAEAVSEVDGRYSLDLPIGHCWLFGVSSPPGYYTQDPKTSATFVTTVAQPRVVRDFVLQPGSPWRVELHGAPVPADKPPHFSATPDPERGRWDSGEIITTIGDAQGKAVLTIPPVGGSYRFNCAPVTSPSPYEVLPANLEIDKDFDPRHVKAAPEPLADRKAVRLRDTAGRSAVVEGSEVFFESGQAVLRFRARPIPVAAARVLRGTVVDEAGKPVAGAKCTAAFAGTRGAAMSSLEAATDTHGKFELRDVRLAEGAFIPDSRISMIVAKSGYDGAETRELNLLEIKKTGTGDFGTVVLKPGHTLRGKVVDENGRPLHGAVVINMTNYFLYGHLICRTDAEGRFVMPDLSFGDQKLAARYGEWYGQREFKFASLDGECVITVKPVPKSPRISAQRKPRPLPPPKLDGDWDLTPPAKEPKYQKEPKYALLVFGPKRDTRVWMVLDGTSLYVDSNANG